METWLVLLRVLLAAGLSAAPSMSQAKQADASSLCRLDILPEDFQRTLATKFSSWKIQEPSNLTPNARGRWESEKPLACPGLAVGEFETPGKSSYAILLVSKNNSDSAYKLLVYAPALPGHLRTLEEWNKGQAANYFIHAIIIAKVFSKDWIRKLNVTTKDGILAADAGENEYGVDVYFWNQGQYRHEPIDY
jgi:hypothetical protein